MSALDLRVDRIWGRVGGGGHGGSHSSSSHSYSHSTSYGSYHSTDGGGGGGGSFGTVIALIILAVIAWYLYKRFSAGPSLPRNRPPQTGAGPDPAAIRDAVIGAALGGALGGGLASRGAGGTIAGGRSPLPPAIDAIRTADPGFEMETFLQRAEMTFFLVKRGIQKNDPAQIRPFLNDALFQGISASVGQMKAQHRHTLLESLNVRALHIVNADCGDQGQRIQVHFDLVYRSKTLDDANRVIADEGDDTRHAERWTFMRAAGAKTSQVGDVTASRCPACGAELRLGLDGACAHCRASVTNGSVDWVVADVQPAQFMGFPSDSIYAAAAPTFMQGVANLKAADPEFSFDAFRVRVRTAFMALQDAWCKQNLDAARAFLSPGAYFAWRAQLETMAAEGRRNVMEGIEVQKIEPTRIVHGRVFDDLTVRITASCADYEVDQNGKIVFGDKTVRPFAEEWTFQRSIGVATTNKAGTLENTCPSCGAPVALTQIGECKYCKAAVTSGKFDWVVSRIEQEDESDGGGGNPDGGGIGEQIALQVGGAIVGGLLGSLLSGGSSRNRDDWN